MKIWRVGLQGTPAFSFFFFASETPKVVCLLPWDKVWETRNNLFPNPKKSSNQGTFERTHQEHCAVTQKLYSRTVNVLVDIQKRSFSNELSVPYLQATWCFCLCFLVYAAMTIGSWPCFRQGSVLKALCFRQTLGSGSKLFHPSTEEYCCHLSRKNPFLYEHGLQKKKSWFQQATTSVKLCFKKILGRIFFDVNQQK